MDMTRVWITVLISLPASATAGDAYKPDYPLVHDCIVSIQTARPEVTMTEQMFHAVMDCEAFQESLDEAESEPHIPDSEVLKDDEG